MKKIILAAAFAVFASGSAMAGDFDGPYVGVEGGYGSHKLDGVGRDSAFHGTAFAGYGVTHGKLYLGGEARVGLDNSKHSEDGVTAKRDLTYGATAKVGMVVNDKTLGYVLGGWERAKVTVKGFGLEASTHVDGYRFGVGAERKINDMLSGRTEVTYTDWGSHKGFPGGNEVRTSFGLIARF